MIYIKEYDKNILLTAEIVLVTIIIPYIWNTWLISHLMAKSSFSVDVIFITCWMVFFIFSPNMQDQCSDIVFNTCIRNNKYDIIALGWILKDILKFIMMSSSCFNIFIIYCMKEKAIGKKVIEWTCSLLLIPFSINLSSILRRIIEWKALSLIS